MSSLVNRMRVGLVVPLEETLNDPAAYERCLLAAKVNGDWAEMIVRRLREAGPERHGVLSGLLHRAVCEETRRRGSVRALLAQSAYVSWLMSQVRYV